VCLGHIVRRKWKRGRKNGEWTKMGDFRKANICGGSSRMAWTLELMKAASKDGKALGGVAMMENDHHGRG